jgi:hypothetical protein
MGTDNTIKPKIDSIMNERKIFDETKTGVKGPVDEGLKKIRSFFHHQPDKYDKSCHLSKWTTSLNQTHLQNPPLLNPLIPSFFFFFFLSLLLMIKKFRTSSLINNDFIYIYIIISLISCTYSLITQVNNT